MLKQSRPLRLRTLQYVSVALALLPVSGFSEIPDEFKGMTQLTDYATLTSIVKSLDADPLFTVSEAGRSSEDRVLWLMRIAHPEQTVRWKMFFYAQQHGNEPAGKEALLYLAQQIQRDPRLLPKGVELWLLPSVNPDGAERDQRRNALGADINRDHMILEQPETQALHRAFQRIRPHLAIDCHEFGRDSEDYLEKGWLEWPEIMMDYANYPLLDDALVQTGASLVERVEKSILKNGINFQRYFVGGVPPEGEQRYSAPDMDGGLNGAAVYGGLSFIIEAGVYRSNNADNHDLPRRVYVYSEVLKKILGDKQVRKQGLKLMKSEARQGVPGWIPTNYFWAKRDEQVGSIPVIDAKTLKRIQIPAPNFMPELVIKRSVVAPRAYVIPVAQSTRFQSLLEHHAIPFKVLENQTLFQLQDCLLDTVEMTFDDLYNRYGGRVLASPQGIRQASVTPGSLLIPVSETNGVRIIALLEPLQLYGLYQYPEFRSLVGEDHILPVKRIFTKP